MRNPRPGLLGEVFAYFTRVTGNHIESDLAGVTSRQNSPVMLCKFALGSQEQHVKQVWKLLLDEVDVFRRRHPREDIPPVCAFRGRGDNVSLAQKYGYIARWSWLRQLSLKMKREVVPRLGVLKMYADGGVYMMRAFSRWERLGSSLYPTSALLKLEVMKWPTRGAMTWRCERRNLLMRPRKFSPTG